MPRPGMRDLELPEVDMNWSEIRAAYPDQWLIIEALEAHTLPDHRRILDQIVVIECCTSSSIALEHYHNLHQQFPKREFYYLHSSRVELDIQDIPWLGIRRIHNT